nr:uncharacterized protein LOC128688166 isoform X1 [Cherax quadricarinatus]
MLLLRLCCVTLLLATVASSEEEAVEVDASQMQDGEPTTDAHVVQVLDAHVAQDRSGIAQSDDNKDSAGDIPEDQIAMEATDRKSLYPRYPYAIPVPLPVPVSPGSLVIPDFPQRGPVHANAKEGTGGAPLRPKGPPKRARPPFRPPPPPPPPGFGNVKPHQTSIYKVPPPPLNDYAPPPLQSRPPPLTQQSIYSPPPQQPIFSPLPPPLNPPQSPNPSYNGPPPPQPNFSAPPPVNTDQNYGIPKPADIFSEETKKSAGAGAAPTAALSQAKTADSASLSAPQISYVEPALLQAAASVPQSQYVPPAPVQVNYNVPPALSLGPIGHSISDADISGSANSYVPPELLGPSDPWPVAVPEMPKIIALDVKCEKNLMKVSIAFDKPFYGIVFSKGHYSNVNCVHLPAGLGRSQATFDVSINACGTIGNTENGLYGYGSQSGSGTYFENTIVVQYDPQVQEVWDQARKLRCTWHDQYEKSVTFRPFPVDMLDVVRADFAGDNVGCWMQIQVGKGPWASEVSGLVKIGQTMTMVLAIKDDDNKFDMLVRNCMAHDGKRAPIQLVDQRGCVTRPKLMSRFTKIKSFGSSASVLSYAHFQAFKFPDSMEVHFQCTIQICRLQCPVQCSDDGPVGPGLSYDAPGLGRAKRETEEEKVNKQKDIGVNRVIQVVSTRDLTFVLDKKGGTDSEPKESETATLVAPQIEDQSGLICMSTPGFAATLIVLLAILIVSCLMSAFLCLRFRGQGDTRSIISSYDNPAFLHKKGHF